LVMGLGFLGMGPTPQSPIPNPQSPFYILFQINLIYKIYIK